MSKCLYYNGVCVDMIWEAPKASNITNTGNMYIESILQEAYMLLYVVQSQ